MKFILARDVCEGMCVAQDVCDPKGRILIARGQRMSDYHVIRLRKFRIQSIFIDERHGEPAVRPDRSEVRDKCMTVLAASTAHIGEELSGKSISLDAEAIGSATETLIEALLRSRNPLVTLLDVSTDSDRLLQHSVNVAVLATVLAIDLRVPQAMLRDLSVACLFHDIGLIFLPEKVREKSGHLTANDVLAIAKHPQLGFEHLVRSEAVSAVASNIVWRHHELLDGTGYPERLAADKISPLVRITTVAEIYDSLTTARFGHPAYMPDAAISFLIAGAGRLFAPEIVGALCRRVALYPAGSAVQLSTGECGVVAGVLPSAPTRPVVLVSIDNRGKQLREPMVVDLTQEKNRTVARSSSSMEHLLGIHEPPVPYRPVDAGFAQLG